MSDECCWIAEGAISTAKDGNVLFDGKGLERERKEILEGMNSEMA
jgi:hypothetical protein